jgi:hypothetical protein
MGVGSQNAGMHITSLVVLLIVAACGSSGDTSPDAQPDTPDAGLTADADDGACGACPVTVDPVCTRGQNATNACMAEHCMGDPSGGTPGLCADGPGCVAAGGTCHAITAGGYFCPDGARFDGEDVARDCAPGAFVNTCCIDDWAQPCTYLGQVSMTLSLDPFTCAAAEWPVCLFTASPPSTCVQDGEVVLSTGGGATERLDVATSVTAGPSGQVTVTGTNAGGRSFTCTGTASADIFVAATWTCETCLGDQCTTCEVDQTDACRLP